MMTTTRQNSASLQRLKNVLRKKNAEGPTTVWKDYIIRTSTKLNSVINFLLKLINVSTETIVPLLTQLKISKSALFIICYHRTRTLIFISFTLRLNGALTIMNTIRLSVYMLTTFKISEESLTYSGMILNFVRTGRVALLSLAMMRDANG